MIGEIAYEKLSMRFRLAARYITQRFFHHATHPSTFLTYMSITIYVYNFNYV